jgi:DNA-directed RNA polymerase subunit RPC12/RpoP
MAEPAITCSPCGQEFPRRALRCPKCGSAGIRYLYKYVRFDDRAFSILRDRKVWFSTASALNDLFEFEFDLTEFHVGGIPIDRSSFDAAVAAMKSYGVLSLSESCREPLMWSHYADSNTGFCIRLERTEGSVLGNWAHCVPVIYSSVPPTFKPLELEESRTVTIAMTTKAERWSYECEWRVLALPGNTLHDLPGPITGIVFGSGMSMQNRRAIAAILGSTVECTEARRRAGTYSLAINPLLLETLC